MNRHQIFAILAAIAGQGAIMLGTGPAGIALGLAATALGLLTKADSASAILGVIQKKLSAPDCKGSDSPPDNAG